MPDGPLFDEILVPLDLGAPAERVLEVASALARASGAGVRLVIVASPGIDHAADEHDLSLLAAKIDAPATSTRVLESNDVATALLDAAGDRRLIVLETRARRSLARIVIGSTTNEVLARTARPVLLVGPQTKAPERFDLLMAAVDSQDAARALVPVAVDWARALGLRVRFVHAVGAHHGPTAAEDPTDPAAIASHLAHKDAEDVTVEDIVVAGPSVADGLVREADACGAAVVALAFRPRSGPRHFALGSVTTAVAHSTTAAVLAVPPPRS